MVRSAYLDVVRTGNSYIKQLESTFSDGVSQGIADAATHQYIVNKYTVSSSKEKGFAGVSTLIEGLVVGGTVAAIILPFEFVNRRE